MEQQLGRASLFKDHIALDGTYISKYILFSLGSYKEKGAATFLHCFESDQQGVGKKQSLCPLQTNGYIVIKEMF